MVADDVGVVKISYGAGKFEDAVVRAGGQVMLVDRKFDSANLFLCKWAVVTNKLY